MKYRVHKIEQNYNQIWHRIKANKNIVVNYNFTKSNHPPFIFFHIIEIVHWSTNDIPESFTPKSIIDIHMMTYL